MTVSRDPIDSAQQLSGHDSCERSSLLQELQQLASELGFTLFGVAPAVEPPGFYRLIEWIEAGYAAEMHYFQNRLEAYRNLDLVLKGTTSVIVLGYPYRTTAPEPALSHQGRIAKYAWGAADYHDLLHDKLKSICDSITAADSALQARGVVDSAPVMEREFAVLAGLGWTGKNSLLLNRQQGSYFFLCCVLTTADLPRTEPSETDHCGTCTRCIDACPTDAFVSPGVVDSRRCISYLTIEHRKPIPLALRPQMGQWVFGCDVCQDVCPWNRFSVQNDEPSLWPTAHSNPLDLLELIEIDEDTFRTRFRKTPLWRPRRRGLLRNAAIVLGNAREQGAIAGLTKLLYDPEPIVRGAAAWALGQIAVPLCQEVLEQRLNSESDEMVRAEIIAATRAST